MAFSSERLSETPHAAGLHRWGRLALWAVIAVNLAYRAWAIGFVPFDPDEFFVLGSASRIHDGQLPYTGYIDIHPPFLYSLIAPAFEFLEADESILDVFRWGYWLLFVGFLALLNHTVSRAWNRDGGLWATALTTVFPFILGTTIHVRHDLPGLVVMTAASALAVDTARSRTGAVRESLAAALLGFGVSIYSTLALLAPAIAVWMCVRRWRRDGASEAIAGFVRHGLIMAAAFGATYVFMFGTGAIEGFFAHLSMFRLERLYQSAASFEMSISDVFLKAPHAWSIIGITAVLANVAPGTWTTGRGSTRTLFVGLLNISLLFLVVWKHHFPQHYVFPALFSSVLAGQFLSRWTSSGSAHGRLRQFGAVTALVVAAGWTVADAHASWTNDVVDFVIAAPEKVGNDSVISPDSAVAWLATNTQMQSPFPGRSKARQMRMLEWMLKESSAEDRVITVWQNPPFRPLPGGYHHGLMIPIYYSSDAFAGNGKLVDMIRRFDPYFSAGPDSAAERIAVMFDAVEPKLIALEGPLAKWFVYDPVFRAWMADRYELRYHQGAQMVYGKRRAGGTASAVPPSGSE